MHDLKFYSEYFFRARPELAESEGIHESTNKDKQQLMNESATAVKGLATRNSEGPSIVSHDVLTVTLTDRQGPERRERKKEI